MADTFDKATCVAHTGRYVYYGSGQYVYGTVEDNASDGVGLVTCSMVGDLYDGTVLSNVGCSDSNSDSKKDKEIELGVGLGLGLPLCASLVAVVFLSVARHRNQRKFDELLAKQTTLRDNYNKV